MTDMLRMFAGLSMRARIYEKLSTLGDSLDCRLVGIFTSSTVKLWRERGWLAISSAPTFPPDCPSREEMEGDTYLTILAVLWREPLKDL